MAEYKLLKTEGRAKRAEFHTVHGTIQTPVFMNVGTIGAIKGAVSTMDLQQIGTQVELSNTYHLHVRPGDKIVKQLGGLHKFMVWDKPILTDSGGFQVFSLAKLRKIKEEGVYFNSHIDGHKIFMGPEESMQIQSNLASTIAMAFDECPSSVADRDYVQKSVDRTTPVSYTHLLVPRSIGCCAKTAAFAKSCTVQYRISQKLLFSHNILLILVPEDVYKRQVWFCLQTSAHNPCQPHCWDIHQMPWQWWRQDWTGSAYSLPVP